MTNITQSLIEARLSNAGLEMTPQRFAVLEYIVNNPQQATAEQIAAVLLRHYPRPSPASVRRTLDTLRDAGVVTEIPSAGGETRYGTNADPLLCDELEDD